MCCLSQGSEGQGKVGKFAKKPVKYSVSIENSSVSNAF